MKLKTIIAGALMLIGAQVSAAELDNVGSGGDGSSLLLSVFDFDNELSYVLNTGLSYADIAGGATASISLDALFNNVTGTNPSAVQWNLFAGDSLNGDFGSFVGTAGFDQTVSSNNQGISSANGAASTFITQINNQFDGGGTDTFSGCTNGTANSCFSNSLADPFNAGRVNPPAWNDNYGQSFAWDNSGGLDETLALYLFETGTEPGPFGGDIAQPATDAVITLLQSTGLQLVASLSSSGQLNITAVPIPAAVWLMGAGLAGLFGISRRRVAI